MPPRRVERLDNPAVAASVALRANAGVEVALRNRERSPAVEFANEQLLREHAAGREDRQRARRPAVQRAKAAGTSGNTSPFSSPVAIALLPDAPLQRLERAGLAIAVHQPVDVADDVARLRARGSSSRGSRLAAPLLGAKVLDDLANFGVGAV